MSARPSTVAGFRRVLDQLPDHATLHIYVHGTTTTVQAEWVDDEGQIQNPVILRATHELFGAGPAETWPGVEHVKASHISPPPDSAEAVHRDGTRAPIGPTPTGA